MKSNILNNIHCSRCPHRNLMFEKIGGEALEKIDTCKAPSFYKKGQVICNEGDEIEDFLYLQTGLVKLYKKSNYNRDQIISLINSYVYFCSN